MDAGKFSGFQFQGIGGQKPLQNKQQLPAPKPAAEAPPANLPTESVQFGFAGLGALETPPAQVAPETAAPAQETPAKAPEAPAQPAASSAPTVLSMEDFGVFTTGLSSVSSTQASSAPKFDGLTALNGLNSTSLTTLGDKRVASLNPLQPKSETRMPTTSIGLLNGLEDSSWTTTSGRQIALQA